MEEQHWDRQIRLSSNLNRITAIAAGISCMTIVLLVLSLRLTRISTNAAVSQATTADQEFKMAQRPWISLTVTAQQVSFMGGMPVIMVSGIMKNVGHSVAMNVMYWPQLIDHAHETGRECEFSPKAQATASQHDAGIVIFPEQSAQGAVPAPMWPPNKIDDPSGVRLIGCVNYISPVDNTPHYTRVAYSVVRKGTNQNWFEPSPGAQDIALVGDVNGASAN